MTEPIHKGKDLPPVLVIHAASGGDSEAMEQMLRYYDDYMSRLCTRTLYDKNGTPHVCVDVHMKRQREREAFFSDLSQAELDKLCVMDRYPSDSIVFSSHGYDLHIDNELVAEAFSALPQTEQSILILHCTLDLADGEIGNLVGMSRSAVQRHRTRALQELREALSALMPKGG